MGRASACTRHQAAAPGGVNQAQRGLREAHLWQVQVVEHPGGAQLPGASNAGHQVLHLLEAVALVLVVLSCLKLYGS